MGLILEPTGNAQGQFQRFGLFTERGSRHYDLLEKGMSFDSDLVSEESNGDGNFTLSII